MINSVTLIGEGTFFGCKNLHSVFVPDSVENCGEWIKAGAVAVGAGGDLTAGAKTGDFDKITEVAKAMVAGVAAARAGK